jgi:tRNA(Ile)-lysidine synthase
MKWRSPSPADKEILLVRPLRDFSKAELLAFARENKIRFRDDASNFSSDFLRNRIRNELLPPLRKNYQPAVDQTILRMMDIVGAEAEFVSAVAQAWPGSPPAPGVAERAPRSKTVRPKVRAGLKDFGASVFFAGARKNAPEAGAFPGFARLPVAVQRKVLQQQLAGLGVVANFELVERLREMPDQPVSIATDASVIRDAAGKVSCRRQESGAFNSAGLELKLSDQAGPVKFAGQRFSWAMEKYPGLRGRSPYQKKSAVGHRPSAIHQEFFDADKIGGGIVLRHWRAGDRFQPIGMTAAVKLQDLFVNAKIPAARRRELVLAATAAGEIFWVENLRIGEKFKLTPATRRQLRWNRSKIAA